MPEFLLHNHDFIPLDKLLKITGLVESGGEALPNLADTLRMLKCAGRAGLVIYPKLIAQH
ncbi:MAG TPA: RNA-binding S4 domain-containing protein [Bacteroidales bacterium]|nr:RNA-binding S4 domain-containing protein [Bacteroidales bacterium]